MKANEHTQQTLQTVLVLGGTGKTGRRIAQQLTAKGWPVRIASRSASPSFDWNDQATWATNMQGVDAVYISYQPDLAVPGATDTIRALVSLAKENGVSKLVLLSGRGEKEAQECEDIIKAAGLRWTILRCAWFNQNFSEGYLLDPLLAGHVALPAGDVKEPFVDVEDIADVAVAALTETGHDSQLYELTGPRLLSFPEAVAEISRATGKPIAYQQVSPAEYKDMLSTFGIPDDYIWLVNYLFSEVLDGRNAHLSDGVQRALGRPAREFSLYAAEEAGKGTW
ncbi:NAD(P)H-binding protein [Chitinophaga solisilvae]|uniref:NmrA family NAD(P)-binding protein n=1 Tax=Chitinophaga solisilvae TaxID=1233460 RepID=UPI00136FE8B2|nr:NAD(P)H-binding protein [Chitinophaga solisilvae]